MKRQPTKWEKILANDTSHKRLMPKIHKELIKKTQRSNLKIGKGSEQLFFSRQDMQMEKKVHEKMFNITSQQGNANQNHSEISPHTCQNGYYKKTKKNNKYWEDVEKRENSSNVGENMNWYSPSRKQYRGSSKS